MTAISVDLDVELLLDEIVSMEIACEARNHGTYEHPDTRDPCGEPAEWREVAVCPGCGLTRTMLVCEHRRKRMATIDRMWDAGDGQGCGRGAPIDQWAITHTRIPERS